MMIRNELQAMDIKIIDDEINKLPTKIIRLFKERIQLAYSQAMTSKNAMHQLEIMNKKLETIILHDEIRFREHCEAVVKKEAV